MASVTDILLNANEIYARADANPNKASRPPVYKAIGISLAIASGLFIGVSFVLKKIGLLRANVKYSEEAGEGYGYLKNAYWWTGMTLMIIGEICNFVAYAFVDAILVTPLGALSVVITTILSAIFLKERLSFVGKIGCLICIIGSVVIVMNAPAQSSAATIQEMQHFVIAPGFLSYAGVIVAGCVFIALWVAPRYGKKSMLVYLSICSLIGGLSVVATQGLGAAVVSQAGGTPQFNHWFLYVLFVFVIITLVTEIIFLNKALNLFNAALVTPTYYVFFTSSTIVTSAILFRGFKGSPTSIATVVMGFLQICCGVILLQLSKSSKDVPDAAVFRGDLDQVRTVAEQEEPESEPKADAIRGTAAIIRRLSNSRQKIEAAEAKRIHEEKLKDQMEPIAEDEQFEWDGIRRRKTVSGGSGEGGLQRRKTLHPPLGMTRFPDEEEDQDHRPTSGDGQHSGRFNGGFLNSFRRSRGHSTRLPVQRNTRGFTDPSSGNHPPPEILTEISIPADKGDDYIAGTSNFANHPDGAMEMSHVFGLPPTLETHQFDGSTSSAPGPPPPEHSQYGKPIVWAQDLDQDATHLRSSLAPDPPAHSAKRQFSFQNVFHRHRHETPSESSHSVRPISRTGLGSRQGSKESHIPGIKSATEEERLGLVKGDSRIAVPPPDYTDDEEEWRDDGRGMRGRSLTEPIREEKEGEGRWVESEVEDAEEEEEGRDELAGVGDRDARMRFREWESRGGGASGGCGGVGKGAFV